MTLRAYGLSVEVPRGWDARIVRRAESDATAPASVGPAGGAVPMSGVSHPVLHLASFALPEVRGDYGGGAVSQMRSADVFVALVEFGETSVGTALFAPGPIPTFRGADFTPQSMQRPIPSMGGAQRFFTTAGRAWCCYAVVGSLTRRSSLADRVNAALRGVRIAAAPR